MPGRKHPRVRIVRAPEENSMHILLINPNWSGIRKQQQFQFKRLWPPLDLAIIAGELLAQGHSVKILDNNVERLPPRHIGNMASCFDKVFVTSTPYDRWQCPSLDIAFFFDEIRHISKDRLYVMGAHITERPEPILRESGARAALLSEPDNAVSEIVQKDIHAKFPLDIPGTAWLRNGRLASSPRCQRIMDMNALPYPAFHLLPMHRYGYEFMGDRFAILESSRGCPHQCHFCYSGMFGTRFRQKSLERFLDEIVDVVRRFNVRRLYFMDLEFGLNRQYLQHFCDAMIRLNLGIEWCCQTRVTDIDTDILNLMKKAGCTLIHFGIESGSDRILKTIGKQICVADAIRGVHLTRQAGIRTAVFMNFGFPGETISEMNATINLAIRLNPSYASFHLIVPFPGTRMATDIGLDMERFPVSQYPHYNFVHHDLHTLKRILRKAYLKFYLRPAYFRQMATTLSGANLKQFALFLGLVTS